MKQRYLFGNWKLYLSVAESIAIAQHIRTKTTLLHVVFFPSQLALQTIASILHTSQFHVGAQNIDVVSSGAATGKICPFDAKSAGVDYALVGHSEMRAAGDSDSVVADKLRAAAKAKLIPVLCVGEPRKQTIRSAQAFVARQLRTALKGWKGKKLFVAYEPVWAISKAGKATPCSAEYAKSMGAFLRNEVRKLHPNVTPHMLYGGNANSKNIADYVDGTHFEGVLSGFASTKLGELRDMAKAIS